MKRILFLFALVLFALPLAASEEPVFVDDDRVEYPIDLTVRPKLNSEAGATAAALTDNSGGTASQTLADITEANNVGSADRVPTENAIASLADEVNKLITDVDNLRALNTRWELAGVNAATSNVAHDANGGLKLTTAGADGDQMIIQAHADSGFSLFNVAGLFGTENSPRCRVEIKTGSAVTDQIIYIGFKLTNTAVTATDDDQAFFRYEDSVNGGEWQFITSRAGTDTTYDTNETVAADTIYDLEIRIKDDRTVQAYINDKPVRGLDFPAMENNIDLKLFIAIETDAAAAKHMYVLGTPKVSRKQS